MTTLYLCAYMLFFAIEDLSAALASWRLIRPARKVTQLANRVLRRFVLPRFQPLVRVRSGLSRGMWIRVHFPEVAGYWYGRHELAVLEALACGVPVVATDLPQLREVIEHGKTGWLAAPADPHSLADTIVEALARDDALRQMAEEGRRQARLRFDVSRNVAKIEDCWQAAESPIGPFSQ